MADPLSFLRKYNVDRKPIIEKNNQIIFGGYSWPKTAKTNYLITRSKNDTSPKEYYTLECVLFLLKNRQLPHPVYVGKATVENIPAVRRPDRKKLIAYLKGVTSTVASIDKSAPIEVPTAVQHVNEEQNHLEVDKKPMPQELLTYLNKDSSTVSSSHKNVQIEIPTTVQRVNEEQKWQEVDKKPTPEELLAYLNRNASIDENVQTEIPTTGNKITVQCVNEKQNLQEVDKKPTPEELLAYLNKDISTTFGIDENAQTEISTTAKHVYEEQNQRNNIKRPRLEEGEEQQVKNQRTARFASPKGLLHHSNITTEHINSEIEEDENDTASKEKTHSDDDDDDIPHSSNRQKEPCWKELQSATKKQKSLVEQDERVVEIDLFFKYIARKVKTFPKQLQLEAERKVASLIFDLEENNIKQ